MSYQLRQIVGLTVGFALASGVAASACPAEGKEFHIVGKPVVTQTAVPEAYGGGFTYDIFLRLNRALPRVGAKRGYAASIRIDGVGGTDGISTLGRRSKRCYATATDMDLPIEDPKIGTEVTLTVKPRGAGTLRTRVALSEPLPAGFDTGKPYIKALGCGK